MTQNELNRAVARSTGETVRSVAELGFGLADPDRVNFDPEPSDVDGMIIDWDEHELQRNVPLVAQHWRQPALV